MRKDYVACVIAILITLAYTLFYSQFHIDPHHDGIILKPAVDVVMGKRLFVDTFTQYGALTTLIQAIFLKFFGLTLVVQRLSAVVFYLISVTLLFLVARKFFSPFVSFGICMLWLITAYFPNREIIVPFLAWSSVYALTFQLASILAFLQYLEKRNVWFLCLSGAMAALTFWARQPVGIFVTLAGIGILVLRTVALPKKGQAFFHLVTFLCGTLIASLPFFVWLLAIRGVHAWWLQSIVLAFNFGNNLSGHFSVFEILAKLFPSVLDSKKNLLWLATVFSCWILLFSQLIHLILGKQRQSSYTWTQLSVAVFSLASWMQFFPANDQSHFFWGGTPMLVVLVLVLHRAVVFFLQHGAEEYQLQSNRWIHQVASGITVIFLFFLLSGFLVTDLKGLRWYTKTPFVTVTSPSVLAGTKVPADEQIVLDKVEKRLDAYFTFYPAKTYINASPDALYTLLDSHIANFHTSSVYWDWTIQPVFTDYLSSLRTYVDTHRPLVIMRDSIPLEGYCRDDLAIHYPVRVHMYQRPLLIRIPVEDIIDVKMSADTLQLQPKIDDYLIKIATYSAQMKVGIIDATGSARVVRIPKSAETITISLTHPLAGECDVSLSLSKRLPSP